MLDNFDEIAPDLIAADECKHYTLRPGIYQNRIPSTHPRA